MYEGLKKQAASVEMVGADKQTPSKVMGPRKSPIKKRGTGGTTKTANGKRGRPTKQKDVGGGEEEEENGAGGGLTDDEDDEDENIDKKRVKLESGDPQPTFGNGEEGWGFEGI